MNFTLKIFVFLIIVITVIDCYPSDNNSDGVCGDKLIRDKRQDYGYYPAEPPRYQYRPIIKYRETRRKRKRLFVPNFFG